MEEATLALQERRFAEHWALLRKIQGRVGPKFRPTNSARIRRTQAERAAGMRKPPMEGGCSAVASNSLERWEAKMGDCEKGPRLTPEDIESAKGQLDSLRKLALRLRLRGGAPAWALPCA